MRIRNIILPLALSCLTAMPAFAIDCYKVKFKNNSNAEVDVYWAAVGCGTKPLIVSPCGKGRLLKPGKSHTYTYGWGTTQPEVRVFVEGKDIKNAPEELEDRNMGVFYSLQHGHFKIDNGDKPILDSAPGCIKHYTIDFTQKVLDQQWSDFVKEVQNE